MFCLEAPERGLDDGVQAPHGAYRGGRHLPLPGLPPRLRGADGVAMVRGSGRS